MMERWIYMIKLGITFLFAIFMMIISPVLILKDQLNFDHLEETSFTPIILDQEIQIVKIASFLELQNAKVLVAFLGNENSAIHTMISDQILLFFSEHFPHDKPFLVVKKFQSNYLS
jgi:hypothetical protein